MVRRLHPEFREAYTLSSLSASALALLIGMPRTKLGAVMNARELRVTPLVLQRLDAIAAAIGYTGDLFR